MSEENKNPEKELDFDILNTGKIRKQADAEAAENRRIRKQNRSLKTWLAVLAVLMFAFGWLFGSFLPVPYIQTLRGGVSSIFVSSSKAKFEQILSIMSNDWFFADSIEDVGSRLTDQALYGMTDNEEDIHTSYMSAEEIESFTQAINRNFVGIGVQFTSSQDGLHIITRVFRDSPAEKAGVQAGDIIHAVDGTVVDDMDAAGIKELVQGEEGTDVNVTFIRENKVITLKITRAQVAMTVEGDVTEEGYGLLEIEQFGTTTGKEVAQYLQEFNEAGVTKLIIDLRLNGGGYLDALQEVMSSFLPADTVFITREYSDGTKTKTETKSGAEYSFSPIVILVSENTASAAEAFTMAMREQRDDVTVVGNTTYGKGTVQVTKYFNDGSGIKYTDSKWMSPDGVWINDTGIEPDVKVLNHEILYRTYSAMEENETAEPDTVSEYTEVAQLCLDYLGYEPDRKDGYFSQQTLECLKKFEADSGLEESETLNASVYNALISAVVLDWNTGTEHDLQMQKAMEILNG